MRRDQFKQDAWKHLARYREDVLQIAERGLYQNVERDHILPRQRYKDNILPSIREDFWRWFSTQRIGLHTLFHHLSSSQAVCFNLFYPYIANGIETALLIQAMGLKGEAATGACFEFIPDDVEGTNIDFMMPLASGARILVEMKYTEDGFPPKRRDQSHVDKFHVIYSPRAKAKLKSDLHTPEGFLRHYQVARNILHLGSHAEDTVVFLVPRANKKFEQLSIDIDRICPDAIREHIKILYLEDLATALEDASTAPHIKTAQAEFRQKYLGHSASR